MQFFYTLKWWALLLTIIISLLALLATFYQAYLQRTHNEKSVRPLSQIDLGDHDGKIYIYIRNNGMGPMIIDKLIFIKNDVQHDNIEHCLDMEPTSYMHIFINDLAKKVVMPNAYFIVFEKIFGTHAEHTEFQFVRSQLSQIKLKVNIRDIYDNKFIFERDFNWFSRYEIEKECS